MTTPKPVLESAIAEIRARRAADEAADRAATETVACEREAVRHFHGGVRAIRLAKVDDFAGHVMAILRAMVEASRD